LCHVCCHFDIHMYRDFRLSQRQVWRWQPSGCSLIKVAQCFRGVYCLHHTSEMSVYLNETTQCYIPEDIIFISMYCCYITDASVVCNKLLQLHIISQSLNLCYLLAFYFSKTAVLWNDYGWGSTQGKYNQICMHFSLFSNCL
jgi:hypothetical protein